MMPIRIPEESCKKNWNNKKNTPTNQMVVFEEVYLSEEIKVDEFI
jgi:hypothetical protein